MERHWVQCFSESLRLPQSAEPRDTERERESFHWNDDSLVVRNTVSSQKLNTMKCVGYVKLTERQPKGEDFVACQRLCVRVFA